MTPTTILDRLGLPSKARRSDSRHRVKPRLKSCRQKRRRAIFENLEDRRVLTTYMVTSLADSGLGSLRAALQSANTTGDTDAIVFDGALAGTINLGVANGALLITSPVSIQGSGSSSVTIDANATLSDKFRVFEISETLAKFCASKGSVCLNGTSLTINEVFRDRFSINLIPHTKSETNWKLCQISDEVNIEIDTLARYVSRLKEYD